MGELDAGERLTDHNVNVAPTVSVTSQFITGPIILKVIIGKCPVGGHQVVVENINLVLRFNYHSTLKHVCW